MGMSQMPPMPRSVVVLGALSLRKSSVEISPRMSPTPSLASGPDSESLKERTKIS